MSKVSEDGLTFGSKPERDRYRELKLRLAAGEIRELEHQPSYVLMPAGVDRWGRRIPAIAYTADFAYLERVPFKFQEGAVWERITEEVKGLRKYRLVKGPRGKLVKRQSWRGYCGRDYGLRVNLFRRRFRDREFREIRMEATK